ncbi:unnamed protein product [Arabidopsis thaliana]|uniref:(thale cress) hypothetical protein n=1 Tax=Arabidopsis thaliana TaxID=3702 RepID=A0A7G2FG76_ARATH|nr:unnamed protein product [Arabidopsis thaliana]
MLNHDAAECPTFGNQDPPQPGDDDDDVDNDADEDHPDVPDVHPNLPHDPMNQQFLDENTEEEHQNASKKRKTNASTSQTDYSFPLTEERIISARSPELVHGTTQNIGYSTQQQWENHFNHPTHLPRGHGGPEATGAAMNTAFWNCRGLKGSLVVQRLKGIKKSYSPDLLFLIETKNQDDVVRDVAAQLDYDNVKCVSPLGIGGGLALMWKKSVSVNFFSFDARLIDCKIRNNMTWVCKRKTHYVECWLDKAMANDQWKASVPAFEVEYLELIDSDHRPAIIKIRKTTEQGTRCFRFDSRLCNRPEFESIVEYGWNHIPASRCSVVERIRNCRSHISSWKRTNNTNSAKRIAELTVTIDNASTDFSVSNDHLLGNEPWLPTTPPRPPLLLATTDPKTTVSALLCPTTSQWDEQKLTALIDPIDHPIIRKIYVPPIPAQDSYVWSFTKDCCYTVKSGYWVAATKSTTSRALGVADNLRRRNIIINPYRAHCCTEAETGNHIFFSCPHAEAVWRTTCLDTTILCNSQTPLEDKLRYLFRIHDDGNVDELHRSWSLRTWLGNS